MFQDNDDKLHQETSLMLNFYVFLFIRIYALNIHDESCMYNIHESKNNSWENH